MNQKQINVHKSTMDSSFQMKSLQRASTSDFKDSRSEKRQKKRNKHKHKNKKKEKYSAKPKRHSVGHCDSSTLSILKGQRHGHDSGSLNKPNIHYKAKHEKVRWDKSTSTTTTKRTANGKRRRSLFNDKEVPQTLDPNVNPAFDEINSAKWDIENLMGIVTEQEFHHTLSSHSKEDIMELCWDLLRSKDKSDELLRMVSLMNHDLEQAKAYTTMITTIE
eukprot:218701_1